MSIIVSNISENYSRVGVQEYEVRLNNIRLAKFFHNSEDGMAICLIKAGEALIGVDIDGKIEEYEEDQTASLARALFIIGQNL